MTVNVPAATDSHTSGEVWLCPITDKAQVAIGRGENSGHTLNYYNVVRRWVKLGDWNGQAQTFTLPLSQLPDADFSLNDVDHLAVIVQSGVAAKPGVMLGAATASTALRILNLLSWPEPVSCHFARGPRAKKIGPAIQAGPEGNQGIEPLRGTQLARSAEPRGAGGLRNPELEPDRALRQRCPYRPPACRAIDRNWALLWGPLTSS